MGREFLERELARFDAELPIERAWTPPSSWYTSAEMHALEHRALFAGTWQPVARLQQLREPGDFVSGCLAGEPWIIVRGQDGRLRAFHNTCRHKGREVVQGCGRTSQLVCGYHAWTYDLEGRLRVAPRMAGVQDFERGNMSLPPLALETWGLWAFINLDRAALPFAPRVAELDLRLPSADWERLSFVDRRTWTLECNWKVYVDNYLDGGYHIPHMHPSLDAQLDMSSYRTQVFDSCSIQSSPAAPNRDDRIDFEAAERIGGGALYAWIYPNFMLNRYGPCLDTNTVLPLGPDRCQVLYDFFFVDSGDPGAQDSIQESIEQSAVTQREDIAICESVQVGLNSSGYDRGRYAPQLELGELHFHRLLTASLRRAWDSNA